MKMISNAGLILSVLILPLVGCGGVEDGEGVETPEISESAPVASEPVSEDEVGQAEQAVRVDAVHCKSDQVKFAGCTGVSRTVVYGCRWKSSGRNAWVKTRGCLWCRDRGDYATCLF